MILALKPADIHAKIRAGSSAQLSNPGSDSEGWPRETSQTCSLQQAPSKPSSVVLSLLLKAVPITTNKATIENTARLCFSASWFKWKLLNSAIKGYDTEIEEKVTKHEDYGIFKDLPGIGHKTIARMIASLVTTAIVIERPRPSKPLLGLHR